MKMKRNVMRQKERTHVYIRIDRIALRALSICVWSFLFYPLTCIAKQQLLITYSYNLYQWRKINSKQMAAAIGSYEIFQKLMV